MERYDDFGGDANKDTEAAKTAAAFGDELFAQLKPPGEGSSVLRPPEIKPPSTQPPGTDTPPPAPKTDAPPPAPRTDAPPPVPRAEAPPQSPRRDAPATPVDAKAAKAKEVIDTIADNKIPVDKVLSKIEQAFKNEPDRAGMEDLARRINE